jgi:selenocysteine-specific elongation factor
MRVIGTAGHVDHGKSTLVQALTGINPDRLREEKERQMTIDIGFAWLDLPGGQTVGIVDVPGHIDFIENMLAGVGGVDAAILVIAADEGVMPQTREHVDILELLGIDRGVVALTKIDVVEDSDWLDLVEEEVGNLLEDTSLSDAPIVRLSARTREGLDTFIEILDRVVEASPSRLDLGRPRLSVDRSFSVAGFGTVVTGTLVDGTFSVGDDVEIIPSGIKGRIRGLQTHHDTLETAHPGSRVAINLSGVEVDMLRRGDAVVHPGTIEPSQLLDVHVRQLTSASGRLRHNEEVKLFLGAAQRMGKIRVLGRRRSVQPGEEGWLQILLNEPLAAAKGDRYILRRPSPPGTLGGGQIVDPHPMRRHRLKDQSVVKDLETALKGSPEEQLETAVIRLGTPTTKEASIASGLSLAETVSAAGALAANGRIRQLTPGAISDSSRLVSSALWEQLSRRLLDLVNAYHREHPMRSGMPQEEAKNRMDLRQEMFGPLVRDLVDRGELEHEPPELRAAGFKVELTPDQQKRAEGLLSLFESAPAPPSMKDAVETAGEAIVRHLVNDGRLVALSREVLFGRAMYDRWLAETLKVLEQGETMTVAQLRDMFGSSRKYALAFMEYLDTEGITLRDGDVRRINSARKKQF